MTEGALLNDRYQLEERLGSGGMADVFLARDVVLDRPVAIKVLQKDYSNNEDFTKTISSRSPLRRQLITPKHRHRA
jgi:Serine/threonine protein kinase